MTIINFQENDFYNPVKDGNYGILAHAHGLQKLCFYQFHEFVTQTEDCWMLGYLLIMMIFFVGIAELWNIVHKNCHFCKCLMITPVCFELISWHFCKTLGVITVWCLSILKIFTLTIVCLMVFNTTFNNISVISWRSILLVEETGGPGENHRPVGHCRVMRFCSTIIQYALSLNAFQFWRFSLNNGYL